MHVVVYLPASFYAAIAATIAEVLQAVNDVSSAPVFTYEFVSRGPIATSKSGVSFAARAKPSQKMDVLVVLAGLESEQTRTLELLEQETALVRPLIMQAQQEGAIIAASCGAAYLLAGSGILNGHAATISWWLKQAAAERFPQVQWQTSHIVVQSGNIYTSGAAFSGVELVSRLLVDLGFAREERLVRKLLVLPPTRTYQSPYELPPETTNRTLFEQKLRALAEKHLDQASLTFLARKLGMSPRNLARRCRETIGLSPGKWLQSLRLTAAQQLLEQTNLSISKICFRVGYQDVASFSRLFSRNTGLSPGEFRKQLQPYTSR